MSFNSRYTLFPVALIISALFLFTTLNQSDKSYRATQLPESKPRYIFVDLGANRADSLEAFLQHQGAKFSHTFPRPEWASYDDAEIFLFEANPVFNTHLVEAKERYAKQGIKVNIFPSTVVDVTDGIRTFFLDTVNDGHDFWGSSIYATHPDAVSSGSKGTNLTSINISTWLLRNTLPHDFVVVKMDIEGAEYEIVPHMAEMRTWVVMDHLLIEWHDATVTGGTPEEIDFRRKRAEAAVTKLKAEGVNLPAYDSSA
ncbi:hypothetical protein BG011_002576 [Mortierella polycephala]|uniref:Methyltransferase FkbM domain-containing protein n=1 Tax=Mortierella polycephala TaxID=41804 RepID=A0A9P6Q315_9FUNG|nr:hypothetical protein BG011_002576 [Mortierella polycephala]